MADKKAFLTDVHNVKNPKDNSTHSFQAGDEVPSWALDVVGVGTYSEDKSDPAVPGPGETAASQAAPSDDDAPKKTPARKTPRKKATRRKSTRKSTVTKPATAESTGTPTGSEGGE